MNGLYTVLLGIRLVSWLMRHKDNKICGILKEATGFDQLPPIVVSIYGYMVGLIFHPVHNDNVGITFGF